MTKFSRSELLDALAQYGYELHRPQPHYKGEEVLLNLLKENDARLLEGFPVAYKHVLDYPEYSGWDGETLFFQKDLSDKEKVKLKYLLLVTRLLFKLYGEEDKKLKQTENLLYKLSSSWKKDLKVVEENFNQSKLLNLGSALSLSTDRLKRQYRNYVVHSSAAQNESEPAMDMELELLLSEFFTSKQKDLLKKRLKGSELSKTEKEYFSRVVNKRLKALSNDHLHDFLKSTAFSGWKRPISKIRLKGEGLSKTVSNMRNEYK